MQITKLDERGRLLIEKNIRDKYGDEFAVFEALGEIVLIPVPKDPLKALREEGKKLPKNMSVKELKVMARELALKEVLDEIDEREKMRKEHEKRKR
ncbi:MAG: hypothetical protein HYW27_02835 [Candidatus Aenigmarchaeota archaeon]|nr:hypothetical protein [Candidatus Aenigmarchaeota archaeon]